MQLRCKHLAAVNEGLVEQAASGADQKPFLRATQRQAVSVSKDFVGSNIASGVEVEIDRYDEMQSLQPWFVVGQLMVPSRSLVLFGPLRNHHVGSREG